MESRKTVLLNLFAGQEERHRHGRQTCGHNGGRRERDKRKDWCWHVYTTMRETANGMLHSTGDSALYPAMARRGGMGGEWAGGPRRRHICVHMADSHCYMADTNNTAKQPSSN